MKGSILVTPVFTNTPRATHDWRMFHKNDYVTYTWVIGPARGADGVRIAPLFAQWASTQWDFPTLSLPRKSALSAGHARLSNYVLAFIVFEERLDMCHAVWNSLFKLTPGWLSVLGSDYSPAGYICDSLVMFYTNLVLCNLQKILSLR